MVEPTATTRRPRTRVGVMINPIENDARRRDRPNVAGDKLQNMTQQYSFKDTDIHSEIESREESLKRTIQELDSNDLLNVSEEDLVQSLVDEFRMDVPIILDQKIYVFDPEEIQVDVSEDRSRQIGIPPSQRGRPIYLPGTKVTIAVPFEGDAELFTKRPSIHIYAITGPYIVESEIRLEYLQLEEDGAELRGKYSADVTRIKERLEMHRGAAESFNTRLESLVRRLISERKKKLLAAAGMVESLGLRIERREGAPNTYSVPLKRKRARIERPKATSEAFQPEPALAIEEYEQILSIMKNMVAVMERSPSAFDNMGEEDLRTHFLVQLNGQYEGQATGETFNFQGKTDILIPVEEKNVFIAECKVWRGEKNFLDTIDQLLSYLSWRDTKTAVVIFSRNANFTDVLSTIADAAPKHPNCKRDLGKSDETTFRYVFHQPNDPNREIQLTVMVFHVPAKKKGKVSDVG
jgi:hypothetical protein